MIEEKKVNTNLSDALWVEKYRPQTLDDIVLPSNYKQLVAHWLENPKDMPHLILVGNPGTGKTSTARLLIKNIIKDEADYIEMNGSSDRGINVIRDDIGSFIKYKPAKSEIKIVFIDEADNLTPDAFKALRAMIETSKTTRFILTGNYDTFPDALKSRCRVIMFPDLNESQMEERCKYVLENERIQYNDEDVRKLIRMFKPDMRKIIDYLQMLSRTGTLDLSTIDLHVSSEDKLLIDISEFVDNNNITYQHERNILYRIYDYIIQNPVSYVRLCKMLFDKYKWSLHVSSVISTYLNQLQNSLIPQPIFIEMIYTMKRVMRMF